MSNNFRLSVSKAKTYDNCHKNYHYTYILKLPRKEFSFHTLGKFCHKVLEDFHQHYVNGGEGLYNIKMMDFFKLAQLEYKDSLTPDMKKEAYDIISSYLKSIYDDDIVKNVKFVEEPFEINIEDKVILNGAIDRIQLDDDMYHVCDYKTTKDEKYLKDDFFQLLVYAYVILNKFPDLQQVKGSYILLRHDCKLITKIFQRDEILAMKDKILSYVDTILSETEYKANPTFLCKYCSHLEVCEEGQIKTNTSKKFGEISW